MALPLGVEQLNADDIIRAKRNNPWVQRTGMHFQHIAGRAVDNPKCTVGIPTLFKKIKQGRLQGNLVSAVRG